METCLPIKIMPRETERHFDRACRINSGLAVRIYLGRPDLSTRIILDADWRTNLVSEDVVSLTRLGGPLQALIINKKKRCQRGVVCINVDSTRAVVPNFCR